MSSETSNTDIRVMMGMLQRQITELSDEFTKHEEEITAEQRKVHDIVAATSDAIRTVARDLQEIKPIVKNYELKAKYIDDTIILAREYQLERAEKAGMHKLLGWLVSVCSLLGGVVAYVISSVIEHMIKARAVGPVIRNLIGV